MDKKLIKIAAILGLLAVILGAFSAHVIDPKLTESQNSAFSTAVNYQFYHLFAILAIAILKQQFDNKWLQWSARFFMSGIICFSGSLYLLACKNLLHLENFSTIIGPVTPLGGLLLIAGWGCLFLGISKKS